MKKSDRNSQSEHAQPITHKVDKVIFVVTPVYQKESDKTIHEILLKMMDNDKGLAK